MTLIHNEEAAAELAALVLDMGMATDKGLVAHRLARKVLGIPEGGSSAPDLVPTFTNGTLRLIPRDEPVFLLRAQDKHAAGAVRFWAGLVAGEAGHLSDIARTALDHADKMDAWPVKKHPNLPR